MTEAEWLFTGILDCNRTDLYLNKDLPLSKDKAVFISSVLRRRFSGEPIQYILGKTEFMGLEFRVTPKVFIPRPETEILVETAVKYAYSVERIAYSLRILDLGTGSGCIAVCLAKFIQNAKITAVDISAEALEVARYNAKLHNLDKQITFINRDLSIRYPLSAIRYDIITSNPPYVSTAEIDSLQPEISYEPAIALDGGKDGLDFYRRIISQASSYLKENGVLILEMGFGQAQNIKGIFNSYGKFKLIEAVRDYSNIERVIVAQKKSK